MTLVTQGSIGFPDQDPVDTNLTYKHCLSMEVTGLVWVLKNLSSPGILFGHFPGLKIS